MADSVVVHDRSFWLTRYELCKKELLIARRNVSMAHKAVDFWNREFEHAMARVNGQNEFLNL